MPPRGSNAWEGERVLVTGATGLIGSHLVDELLARGATVGALVVENDPFVDALPKDFLRRIHEMPGRLEDAGALVAAIKEHQPSTVFHLGAQTLVQEALKDPVATFEANVRGTYLLLEACRRQDDVVRRVVVASSDKAYGTQKELPYTEETPLAGRGPYEASKSCTDLIAQSFAASFHQPVTIARCGNVFGARDQNWSRLVPGTVRSLLQGEAPIIRSDGTHVRDYLYVKDVASAYLDLAEATGTRLEAGEAVNFSYERPLPVLAMVDLIQDAVGGPVLPPRVLGEARMEIHDQHLSSQKARARLGWRPRFTIETGLQETVGWYRHHVQRRPRSSAKRLSAARAASPSTERSST